MRYIIILLATSLHFNGYNQVYTDKVDATWGDEIKIGKRASISDIIGHDSGGFYLLMTSSRPGMIGMNTSHEIWYVGNDLEVKKSEELKPSRDLKLLSISNVIMFDEKIYALGYIDDKRENLRSIVAIPVSMSTLSLEESKMKTLAKISYDSRRNKGVLTYRISENQKVLAIQIEKPIEEGEESTATFKTFDTDFSLIWEEDFVKKISGEDGLYEGSVYYMVDDEGTVYEKGDLYALASQEAPIGSRDYRKRVKEHGDDAVQSYFSVYYKGSDEPLRTPLIIDDKRVHSFAFIPLDNGNVAFSGLYGNDGSFSANGVLYFEVNPIEGTISDVSTHDFDTDFITQNWTDRARKKAKRKEEKRDIKPVLYQYDLKNFFKLENGDYCMIAEQFYVRITTHTTTGANGQVMTTTTYHYYYMDMIVASFDESGQFKWVKKIPKKQHSTNDGGKYSSFYAYTKNNKVYVIFNDNAENVNVDNEDQQTASFFNMRKGVCALATIDTEGNIEREWMFNLKDENVIAVPKVSAQIDDERHLLFTMKRKKSRFVLFETD